MSAISKLTKCIRLFSLGSQNNRLQAVNFLTGQVVRCLRFCYVLPVEVYAPETYADAPSALRTRRETKWRRSRNRSGQRSRTEREGLVLQSGALLLLLLLFRSNAAVIPSPWRRHVAILPFNTRFMAGAVIPADLYDVWSIPRRRLWHVSLRLSCISQICGFSEENSSQVEYSRGNLHTFPLFAYRSHSAASRHYTLYLRVTFRLIYFQSAFSISRLFELRSQLISVEGNLCHICHLLGGYW